jgi:hypothetical protein
LLPVDDPADGFVSFNNAERKRRRAPFGSDAAGQERFQETSTLPQTGTDPNGGVRMQQIVGRSITGGVRTG